MTNEFHLTKVEKGWRVEIPGLVRSFHFFHEAQRFIESRLYSEGSVIHYQNGHLRRSMELSRLRSYGLDWRLVLELELPL